MNELEKPILAANRGWDGARSSAIPSPSLNSESIPCHVDWFGCSWMSRSH